jgi:hypothetical protein
VGSAIGFLNRPLVLLFASSLALDFMMFSYAMTRKPVAVKLEASLAGLCPEIRWKPCVVPVEITGASCAHFLSMVTVTLYSGDIPHVSSVLLAPLVKTAQQLCIAGIKTVDRRTDHQIAAKVRQYFPK